MDNHYHLLVETPEGNLSKGMRQWNGVYTQRFNRRQGRVGHVFQGRYKAILVEKESYLLELSRYIVLNPVRARMVRDPAEWPWSSYRATADLCDTPVWLRTDGVLSAFSEQHRVAVAGYVAFVAAGINQPSPWDSLKNQIFLGSDAFVTEMQGNLCSDIPLHEIPVVQRRPPPKPLSQFVKAHERDEAIYRAYASGGYSLKEIGDYFGLHYSRISRVLQKQRVTVTTQPQYCGLMDVGHNMLWVSDDLSDILVHFRASSVDQNTI
jgi:hypothetical protein